MKYCIKCLMPDTKPYIAFDDRGVCTACQSHEMKNDGLNGIDWESREDEFFQLVTWAKAQNAPYYDALVPVSGGKDSISQVHRLLGHELRILAVNVDYGVKTKIGKDNLGRIPEMGANLIILTPELETHKKLIRIGLEDYGDPDLLSHTLLHAYPLHIALRFQIPLAVLGENSAFEYGGAAEIANSREITRVWFDSYACNNGQTPRKIGDKYKIPYRQLCQYDFPDSIEHSNDTRAVFLSHFFRWSSEENLKIALKYGFKALDKPGEGTYRTYVGIDEMINRIHQYQKVLKFGYGRATDHACEDIRNGILSRADAKNLVKKFDLQELGPDHVSGVCEYLNYKKEEFINIIEQARNLKIWQKDSSGCWTIPGHLED